MRLTAITAAVLTVALLSVSQGTAAAANLATVNQSNFVENVLLAYGDNSQNAHSLSEKSTDTKEAVQPVEQMEQPTPAPEPVMVTVEAGDNLTKIAAAYSTTWQRIYDANPSIANPNIINSGDQLRIPAADEVLTPRELPQATETIPTAFVAATSKNTFRTTAQISYPVSADSAKAFIYAHESGNNPNATNPNGCYGLGQDCNGRVRTLCGADYACQDAFFTNYAMARYGSWAGALAFWQSHHWW